MSPKLRSEKQIAKINRMREIIHELMDCETEAEFNAVVETYRKDIIDLKQNRTHAASHPHACNVDNEAVTGTYYVRTAKLASFTGLIDQKIDEETFLTAAVSMNGLLQAVKNADDPALFLAEVDR